MGGDHGPPVILPAAVKAIQLHPDVHFTLCGDEDTIIAALNYSTSLVNLQRFEEAKTLLQKTLPVARSVLGEGNETTLRLMWNYGRTVNEDPAATLDDLREAVTTLEPAERTARRVLGGANPITVAIERVLRNARAALRARETPQEGA